MLPKRKRIHLKEFDYSQAGAYFITVCTQDKRCLLSRIVGRGLAPAVECTKYGEIAKRQLLLLQNRFSNLTVSHFVIMPNHIHAIFVLSDMAAGASPRPTIMDIVCAFKSLTTIECKAHGFNGKLFQSSFYDHVIRGEADHNEIAEYIEQNPLKWELDKLYAKE